MYPATQSTNLGAGDRDTQAVATTGDPRSNSPTKSMEAGVQMTAGPVTTTTKRPHNFWPVFFRAFLLYALWQSFFIAFNVVVTVLKWERAIIVWVLIATTACFGLVVLAVGIPTRNVYRLRFCRLAFTALFAAEYYIMAQLYSFSSSVFIPLPLWLFMVDLVFCCGRDEMFSTGPSPPTPLALNISFNSLPSWLTSWLTSSHQPGADHGNQDFPGRLGNFGKYSWLSRLTKADNKDGYQLLKTPSEETLV